MEKIQPREDADVVGRTEEDMITLKTPVVL
jgi:hypothetical protein